MKREQKKQKIKFTQEFLSDLVEGFDIVDFIGEYLPLTKSGQNYKTLCPFHSEKTPSFMVSPSKKIYHCFSCAKGGNILTFLTMYEGLTFYEAVSYLTEKAGKSLPFTIDSEEHKKRSESKARLKTVNVLALQEWKNSLIKSSEAQKYLTERNISQTTVDTFELGFAEASGFQLANSLTAQKISKDDLLLSGVCGVSESNVVYDKFKYRLITPIHNLQGLPIGFSGRTLSTEKKKAKYINTADTDLYSKGNNLFGLYQTKEHIKNKGFAVLTEGNFDVLSLYQNGVTNVVAGLGTAFTDAQAKLLKRFTDKVVICYDGDEAGRESAEKTIKPLLAEQFIVKVMELPNGADPDSYIQEVGYNTFNELRGKSVSWLTYLLTRAQSTYDVNNPTEKVKILDKVNEFIKLCKTDLERKEYYSIAVKTLKLDKVIAVKNWNDAKLSHIETQSAIKPTISYSLSEYKFLQLLPYVNERLSVVNSVKDFFQSPEMRKIALIMGNISGEFKYHILESVASEDVVPFIRELLLEAEDYVDSIKDVNNELSNCIQSMKRDYLVTELNNEEEVEKNSPDWESSFLTSLDNRILTTKKIVEMSQES